MIEFAQGGLLGRARLAADTDTTLFAATLATEVTLIVACDTVARQAPVPGQATESPQLTLCHSTSAPHATGEASALYWNLAVCGTLRLAADSPAAAITLDRGDALVARATAPLTVSVYGVTENLNPAA